MARAIIGSIFLLIALVVLAVGFCALLDGRYLLSIASALYAAIATFLAYIFAGSLRA